MPLRSVLRGRGRSVSAGLLGVLVFGLCAAVTTAWWAPRPIPISAIAAEPAAAEMLFAACVQAMVSDTCQVMGDAGALAPMEAANSSAPVFVAGASGPIDAASYAQLYAAGEAMCSVVKDACAKDWNSGQCSSARKLWMQG